MSYLLRKLALCQTKQGFQFGCSRALAFDMTEKALSIPQLEEMTKEQLVSKVSHFQACYRQLLNQKLEESSSIESIKVRKKKRFVQEIDFKSCYYRRIALKFAYLGWDYSGLQENPHLTDTIEHVLRKAIRQVKLAAPDDPLKLSRCGRTDKGVSAFQQVVTLRVRTRLTSGPGITKWIDPSLLEIDDREAPYRFGAPSLADAKDFSENSEVKPVVMLDTSIMDMAQSDVEKVKALQLDPVKVVEKKNEADESCDMKTSEKLEDFDFVIMLNRVLPPEIRVLAWSPVENESFSARHDCIGREYRYYFPQGKLNIEVMNNAAKLFCGLHDFRNFGKLNVEKSVNYVRRIDTFEVKKLTNKLETSPYNMCQAIIKGSGFIYHQVRCMMAVLYLIGAELEKSKIISELLDIEKNSRKPSYGLAEANPLVLYKTDFKDLKWTVSKDALSILTRQVRSYWCDMATKACLAGELVTSIENDVTVAISQKDNDSVLDGFEHYKKVCNDTDAVVFRGIPTGSRSTGKPYRRIMDRPAGCTIEEKLDSLQKKRQRLAPSNSSNDEVIHSS